MSVGWNFSKCPRIVFFFLCEENHFLSSVGNLPLERNLCIISTNLFRFKFLVGGDTSLLVLISHPGVLFMDREAVSFWLLQQKTLGISWNRWLMRVISCHPFNLIYCFQIF